LNVTLAVVVNLNINIGYDRMARIGHDSGKSPTVRRLDRMVPYRNHFLQIYDTCRLSLC
jgi:hypothetical protein